ncbi:hypothetical protein JRO89_XS01G0275400 [Xanthoceras sorbifolium]|uniref:tryptophan synthase n=1 Tax=Xanthoceras sorbifolium TaxID=99658 RepID=A0ABQ8IMI0_9ROSI|nr:hypothetical protein JRO89_XS01G0275400 [Xanthoceras sorbifolium]
MAALNVTTSFLQLKNDAYSLSRFPSHNKSTLPTKRFLPMATLTASSRAVGLADTFTRLKQNGKVAFIPYITAGDPDLSTTAEALKVLDSCGCDIIELGVPYSDPLADGPVIQAAATRSLARGTNLNAIILMLKEVVPQLSCPIALFTYYNPILKRGVEKFMSTIKDVGVHGLVVPDVPLEETEFLRKEALKHKLELVLLTTLTTPTDRMKAIVEASEGFVYLVSAIGVTGARVSINNRVQTLIQDIKEGLIGVAGVVLVANWTNLWWMVLMADWPSIVDLASTTTKPVAVGFGISKPEHVKQIAGWGADGVIVGSAIVKLLGEAKSPEEGLKELENFTKSLKSALP